MAGCTYNYKGKDYDKSQNLDLQREIYYDYIKHRINIQGKDTIPKDYLNWYAAETRKRVLDGIKESANVSDDQATAITALFDTLAKSWGLRNSKDPSEYFNEVLTGLKVLDPRTGEEVDLGNSAGFILDLSTNADPIDVVKGFSGIFFNTLSKSEQDKAIKALTGIEKKWEDLSSSEIEAVYEAFSDNFLDYLKQNPRNAASEVMEQFSRFFTDLTESIIGHQLEGGGRPTQMSNDLMNLYDAVLNISQTENTRNFKHFSGKSVFDRLRSHGIQVKKRTAEELKRIARAYIGNKYGENTAEYVKSDLNSAVERASVRPEARPDGAYVESIRFVREYNDDPHNTRGLTAEQQIAMTFAATEIEKRIEDIGLRLQSVDDVPWKTENGIGERADLLEIREILSAKLDTITSAISISRSLAGYTLGMGTHLIKRNRYSKKGIMDFYKSHMGTSNISDKERRFLEDLANKISEQSKAIFDTREGAANLRDEQMFLVADMILAQIEKSSDFKEFMKTFNKGVKSHKRSKAGALGTLKKAGSGDNVKSGTLNGAIKFAIFDLIKDDSVDTSSFLKLASALVDSEYGQSLKLNWKDHSDYAQRAVRDALITSSDEHKNTIQKYVASDLQNVKTEIKLLDRLSELLGDKETSKWKKKNFIHSDQVEAIRDVLTDLTTVVLLDSNVEQGTILQLTQDIDRLLSLLKPGPLKYEVNNLGEVTDETYNRLRTGVEEDIINDILQTVRNIKLYRDVDKLKEKRDKLQADITEFQKGNFADNVFRVLPQYDAAMFLNILRHDDRVSSMKEYKEYKAARTNQQIIEHVFNSITKGSSGLVDFDDMVKQTLEYLKDSGVKRDDGKDLTPEDVMNAITKIIDKPMFIRGINEKLRAVRQEGRVIQKLIDYATEIFKSDYEEGKSDLGQGKIKRSQEINKLLEELEVLSKINYSQYTVGVLNTQTLLTEIKEQYQLALTRDSGSDLGSLDEIIENMRKYEVARQSEAGLRAEKRWEKELERWKKMDISEIRAQDIKWISSMFPKFIDENLEEIRKRVNRVSNEAKNELKKKILVDYIRKIKDAKSGKAQFNLDELEDVLGNDNKITQSDRSIRRRNREVQILIASLREYIKRQKALRAKGDIGSTIRLLLKDVWASSRVTVLAGDASYVTYQGGFAIPFLIRYPDIGAKVINSFLLSHAKEFRSSWFAKQLSKGWKFVGGDDSWIYEKGAASKHFYDYQNLLKGSVNSNSVWEDAVDNGVRLIDTDYIGLEEELQMMSLTELMGVGGMMRYAIPGFDSLYSKLEKNVPVVGKLFNPINDATKGYLKNLRGFGERTYMNHMNTIRLEMYNAGVNNLTMYVSDRDDYENAKMRWADYVNTMTGGGTRFTGSDSVDRKINSFVEATAGPLIAPRLYASALHSTIETTLIPDVYRAVNRRLRKEPQSDAMSAVEKMIYQRNLLNLAVMTSWHTTMYLLKYAITTGAIVDDPNEDGSTREESVQIVKNFWNMYFNPFNSGFGKVDVWDQRIALTPMGGYLRSLALLTLTPLRGLTDLGFEATPMKETANWKGIMGEFIQYRFNPVLEALATQGLYNQDFMGRKLSDDLATRGLEVAKSMGLMIWMQGIIENLSSGQPARVVGSGILDVMGVNNYENNPFYSQMVQSYLEKPFRSNKSMRPNTGIPYNHKLKGTFKEVQITDRMRRNFGHWVQDELYKNNKPFRSQLNRKWKQARKEAFEYYGEKYGRKEDIVK